MNKTPEEYLDSKYKNWRLILFTHNDVLTILQEYTEQEAEIATQEGKKKGYIECEKDFEGRVYNSYECGYTDGHDAAKKEERERHTLLVYISKKILESANSYRDVTVLERGVKVIEKALRDAGYLEGKEDGYDKK